MQKEPNWRRRVTKVIILKGKRYTYSNKVTGDFRKKHVNPLKSWATIIPVIKHLFHPYPSDPDVNAKKLSCVIKFITDFANYREWNIPTYL